MFGVLPLLVLAAGYFESPRERGGTSYEEGELFEQFRAAAAAHELRADWTHVGDKFQLTIDGLMPELSLGKETIGTGVSKRLTGADVEIGDSVFDDAALVTGASLEILSRLNHEQRARTHSLLKVGGSISVGVLSVSVSTLSDVLDRPEAMDVVALAKGFSANSEGTKEERLLGILHEDPNPAVRAKVLAEMMRHPDELELDLDELLRELILGASRQVERVKRLERLKRKERLERARRLETLRSRIQSEKHPLRAELLIELEPSRWRQPEPQVSNSTESTEGKKKRLNELIAEATEIEAWLEADNTEEPITEATEVTEAIASEVLLFGESSLAVLSAAFWLREHGEAAESVAALSEALTDSPSQEVSAVAGQALATIRSRLGQFAGGLALSESQDAGALSLAAERGQLSVAEEEVERKRRAAVERQKR